MKLHDRHRTALAWLGLKLARPTAPKGAPPNDEELALFVDGRLGAARRREIITHLLADDSLYQRLVLLGSTLTPTPRKTSDTPLARCRHWLEDLLTQHRLAMAGLALAGLAAVVALPHWMSSIPITGQPGQPATPVAGINAGHNEMPDWKQEAILRGYREAPEAAMTDPATPEATLRVLGHWLQKAERACTHPVAEQQALLEELAHIRRHLPDTIQRKLAAIPEGTICQQASAVKESLGLDDATARRSSP